MENHIERLKEKFEPDLLNKILSLDVNKLPKDFSIQGNKEEPGAIPIVLKGAINISKTDSKGRRFPVYTIEQGESCIIAIDAILHNSVNRGQDGITAEDTETVVVSAELSKKWIEKYPTWRQYIFDLYSKRLDELIKQHELVTEQNSVIKQKNESIEDSIKYASRIQQAVLPSNDYMRSILSDYFVLNRPRDIVSGDFYWVEQKNNKLVVVAADSTGHGVPGAFMSLLGVTMLNEIVFGTEKLTANQILENLRLKIKKSLKQQNNINTQKDGFDMAICLIDLNNHTLEFSGAYNPLYLIRNNETKIIKADKMPVGVYLRERKFTNHQVDLQKNDMLYMFSDGFADQMGGESGGKFKTKNFRELLIKIHKKTTTEQYRILSDTFDKWKGTHEQTDDVLVMGVKI